MSVVDTFNLTELAKPIPPFQRGDTIQVTGMGSGDGLYLALNAETISRIERMLPPAPRGTRYFKLADGSWWVRPRAFSRAKPIEAMNNLDRMWDQRVAELRSNYERVSAAWDGYVRQQAQGTYR